MKTTPYILFYDDSCGMCSTSVNFIASRDRKKRFSLAPLTGKTADELLTPFRQAHPDVDSIVLLRKRDGKIFFYSKAIFRILWEIGPPWVLIGWFSFLPQWLLFPCDVVYRLIAKRRKKLCPLTPKNRISDRFSKKLLP